MKEILEFDKHLRWYLVLKPEGVEILECKQKMIVLGGYHFLIILVMGHNQSMILNE